MAKTKNKKEEKTPQQAWEEEKNAANSPAEEVAEPEPAEAEPAPRQPVEDLLAAKNVNAPIAAALMRYKRWGKGQKLTENQFDQALQEMLSKPASQV